MKSDLVSLDQYSEEAMAKWQRSQLAPLEPNRITGTHIRDLQNAFSEVGPRSNLNQCLSYFREEGLTDEQIRKAITPALFAVLKGKSMP